MWRVRGFSIQGYAHLTEGTPCQDAYRQATVGTSALLAVADGAGSRPRSAEAGLQLVRVGQAYQWIRDQFIKQVTALAGQGQAGEFAATLIAAVVTDGLLGIIQVGDGFAVSRTRNQHGTTRLHLLTQPTVVGQYSNETVFITSPGASPVISCFVDDSITGVLLSTDGLMPAALAYERGQPETVNEDFAGRVLGHLDADGRDPRLIVRTMLSDGVVGLTGDDLTLLAAVRA